MPLVPASAPAWLHACLPVLIQCNVLRLKEFVLANTPCVAATLKGFAICSRVESQQTFNGAGAEHAAGGECGGAG